MNDTRGPVLPLFISDCQQRKRIGYFVLLLICLSLSYFIFGTYRNWPYKIESDGKYYYQYLVSGINDWDFDFSNNYIASKYPWMRTEIDLYKFRDVVHPVTGRPMNAFTIGPAILWTPFFITAKIVGAAVNNLGFHVDMNPWGKFFQYAVMYSAVAYTVMALYFLYRLLAPFYPEPVSLHAPLFLLVSTNLCYYAVFEVSMSHVYDLLTYTAYLFIFAKCAHSQRLAPFVSLAVTGAFHVLVRTQNVVTILIFSAALVLILFTKRDAGVSFKLLGAYAVTLLVGLLPIPLINIYLFGNPLTIPQGIQFLDLAHPHVLGVLFSGKNGLFSHHPVLLLGGLGFIAFLSSSTLKATPSPCCCSTYSTQGLTGVPSGCLPLSRKEKILFFGALFVAFVLQVYINSTTSDWWAGHSFGQRRLISSFPLFVFGLAYLMDRLRTFSQKWYALTVGVISLSGLYLMFIHVFLWDYDKPHNIVTWMLWAPLKVLKDYSLK